MLGFSRETESVEYIYTQREIYSKEVIHMVLAA